MRKRLLPLFLALLVQPLPAASPIDGLESDIRRIIADKRAQVGVAVIRNGETLLTIGNEVHYPLMSVMKFHQALTVAEHMRRSGATLRTPVRIEPQDLKPDTYSPLRDRYGRKSFYLPIDSLLDYSLRLSDNNACDLLFACVGGPEAIDRHIRAIGGRHFAIAATEEEMHRDPSRCRDNWSTPLDAARLMDDFIASSIGIPSPDSSEKACLPAKPEPGDCPECFRPASVSATRPARATATTETFMRVSTIWDS